VKISLNYEIIKRALENLFFTITPGGKLIFFAPFRAGANEENQFYQNEF
jgi:hypothetical protein